MLHDKRNYKVFLLLFWIGQMVKENKFLTMQYYTFMLPFISDLTGANAVGPKTSVGQQHNETENTN